MKKLLLSSLLLAGGLLSASAQDLYVLFEGEAVENGGVVNFEGYTATPDADFPEWVTWKVDPELYMVAGEQSAITIKAVANTSIQLCAGGNCINGTEITKPVEKFTANEPLNLQLDWETTTYDGTTEYSIPAIQVEVSMWYDADPTNVYSFTVNMGGMEAAGVEELLSAGSLVSFSNNTLNYDLPGASQITIYSLSGKTVMNKSIAGNGSLNLGNLSKGIYLYKISGKANKTAKIVIR